MTPVYFAVVMIAAICTAGALRLSFWTIPLFGLAMSFAYMAQKLPLWREAARLESAPKIAFYSAATAAIQFALTALLFLAPFGISASVSGSGEVSAFGTREIVAVAVCAAAAACAAYADRIKPAPAETVETGDVAAALEEDDPYFEALAAAAELSVQGVVMPVEIFRLANRIAELPDAENALHLVRGNLIGDDSMHVRRVALIAIRNIGRADFESVDVRAMVMQGLDDPHGWPRYDAVWAADVLDMRGPAVDARLTEIADGLEPPPEGEPIPSSGAAFQARVRAARLIAKRAGA